mmetsp:Transcript_492/g.1834  ORF Transcript_492/g.1834 Transcript_492/m.1834 type:complete len:256 (-) Transcript_492:184-951(-)
MASAEVGLAPSGCESYSPTYLAQALPDTLRLLRKRGAWEMSDHNEIAGQGERVRKILSLVKCLLTAKKVKSDSEPSEVVPDVFLGSIGAAHNREVLERLGITHILTVAGGFEPKFPQSYVYECVDVKDVPEERLCVHFDRCLKFIAKCLLDGGRVLVHCFAGKSRSATVCAAYIMATEGLSLEETLRAIGDARPAAAPNHGFMAQLASFERELTRARTEGRLLGRVQLDARRAASGLEELAAKSSEGEEGAGTIV